MMINILNDSVIHDGALAFGVVLLKFSIELLDLEKSSVSFEYYCVENFCSTINLHDEVSDSRVLSEKKL